MTRIVLVRHAEAAPSGDLARRDWPLTETGRRQAAAVASLLAELGVEALVSSPYLRAIDTLRPYAERASLEIGLDDDLRERDLGAWLADADELERAIARMHAEPDYRLEGGESARQCLARFDAALARVAAANRGRCVAVGSHGAILSHFLARHRTDLPQAFWRRIRNPHLFVFDFTGAPRWEGERTLAGVEGLLPA